MYTTIKESADHFKQLYKRHRKRFSRLNGTGKWSAHDLDQHREDSIKLDGIAEALGLSVAERADLEREALAK